MIRSKTLLRTSALLLSIVLTISEPASLYAAGDKTSDKDLPQVGTDGYEYDADYISKAAFASLDDDAKEAYTNACDEIAYLYSNNIELKDVIFATDENGSVYYTYSIPRVLLADALTDTSNKIISDISDNQSAVDISSNDENKADALDSDDKETSVILDVDNEDLSSNDPSIIEPADEDEVSTGYISENLDLFPDLDFDEEDDEAEVSFEENLYDSLLTYFDESYFYNQMSELEAMIYKAAKKAFVSKGKSSFTFKCNYSPENDAAIMDSSIMTALSAVINTYPNSFNRMDTSKYPVVVTSKYDKKTWSYKVKLKQSARYTDTIQTKAEKKVKNLVKEAYNYAGVHYNEKNNTYGIIDYFDNWLCANTTYAEDYVNPTDDVLLSSAEYFYSNSAYGALLKGYGTCNSYAKAMSWLLDSAGITNMYVVNGTHAYNYVYMPDDCWYILDSTKNDVGDHSSKAYFLSSSTDSYNSPDNGKIFTGGRNLLYPDVSVNDYPETSEEEMFINLENVFALSVGKKKTIRIANEYYNKFTKKWSSDNKKIATVTNKGKVTALKLGKTNINCTVAGRKVSTELYVYELTKITIGDTKKTKINRTYSNTDTDWTNDHDQVDFYVNQKKPLVSARALDLFDTKLAFPTVTSSDKKVATATIGDEDFLGDRIRVHITPLKPGKTTITVKFGGKTATINYTVKQSLMNDWFNELDFTEKPYRGREYKPAITKSETCPAGITYKVSYKNVLNAGTATVTVTGTGNYNGTVTRTFTITPLDLSYNGSFTCSESKKYTGSAVKPSVTVLYKKEILKKNRDYKILYKLGNTFVDAPVNAGKYTVIIQGINNYEDELDSRDYMSTQYFEVKKINSSDLTLTCPSKVKWKNDSIVYPKISVMYGENVIPQDILNTSYKNYSVKYYLKSDTEFKTPVDPKNKGEYVVVVTLNGQAGNINISKDKNGNDVKILKKSFKVK